MSTISRSYAYPKPLLHSHVLSGSTIPLPKHPKLHTLQVVGHAYLTRLTSHWSAKPEQPSPLSDRAEHDGGGAGGDGGDGGNGGGDGGDGGNGGEGKHVLHVVGHARSMSSFVLHRSMSTGQLMRVSGPGIHGAGVGAGIGTGTGTGAGSGRGAGFGIGAGTPRLGSVPMAPKNIKFCTVELENWTPSTQ
eukprot:scaffold4469_cov193-Prasinococcus_capsulatus_cf.AAC.3